MPGWSGYTGPSRKSSVLLAHFLLTFGNVNRESTDSTAIIPANPTLSATLILKRRHVSPRIAECCEPHSMGDNSRVQVSSCVAMYRITKRFLPNFCPPTQKIRLKCVNKVGRNKKLTKKAKKSRTEMVRLFCLLNRDSVQRVLDLLFHPGRYVGVDRHGRVRIDMPYT